MEQLALDQQQELDLEALVCLEQESDISEAEVQVVCTAGSVVWPQASIGGSVAEEQEDNLAEAVVDRMDADLSLPFPHPFQLVSTDS